LDNRELLFLEYIYETDYKEVFDSYLTSFAVTRDIFQSFFGTAEEASSTEVDAQLLEDHEDGHMLETDSESLASSESTDPVSRLASVAPSAAVRPLTTPQGMNEAETSSQQPRKRQKTIHLVIHLS
jgi:hypothetical protein